MSDAVRSFDIQLVRYAVGGAREDTIPTLKIEISDPAPDSSTIEFYVPGAIYTAWPRFAEVAVEYWDDTQDAWVEPRNGRYMVKGGDVDNADPSLTYQLTGIGLIDWFFEKAKLHIGGAELDANGKRRFENATPGAIIKTLIDEAQAREAADGLRWAPWLEYDFTASVDSTGAAWVSMFNLGYDIGLSTLTVLRNLLDQGACEMHTEGRMVRLFNPDSGVDHDIRLGIGAAQLPVKFDIDDLITHATLAGDEGLFLDIVNPNLNDGLGRLEGHIKQGGVSDEGTATTLLQHLLYAGSQVREQLSHTENANTAEYLPWRDYNTRDWVQVWRDDQFEPVRVQEIVVSKEKSKLEVTTVLNDRFLDILARLARRTVGIDGGAVNGGAGGGLPAETDTRQPKAPTGLIVSSEGYWGPDGRMQSQASAEWSPVSQGLNDVAIDIENYELWGRSATGAPIQFTTTESTTATWSPFEPGSEWLLKVRARSIDGVLGPFSAEVAVTMADAVLQLEKPLAPIVMTRNGVVVVATTGLFDTDPPTQAPASFREFRVERSPAEAGPYTAVGVLTRDQDSRVFTDMQIGDTWWFRLVAIDQLGRESAPSAPASTEVVGIDGVDLIVGTLEGNRVKAGTLEVTAVVPGFGNQLQIDGNVTIIAQQSAIDGVADDVDAVAGDVATVADAVETMSTYFDFQPDGLVISAPGSDFSQRIASDRTEMRQGAQVISAWEAAQMIVPRLVTQDVILGGTHQWKNAGAAGSVIRALQ